MGGTIHLLSGDFLLVCHLSDEKETYVHCIICPVFLVYRFAALIELLVLLLDEDTNLQDHFPQKYLKAL